MKTLKIVLGSCAALALALGIAVAKDTLKSGPQTGDKVPGPFEPLNVTGEMAGQKACLYCKNGMNPVAMIFARELTPQVTRLIKDIDSVTAKNADAHMGSFVVFLSDSDSLPQQLKDLAKERQIKQTVLSTYEPTGPAKYNVASDADVTVVLYTKRTVKANYSFKKGELTNKAIEQIVAAVPKILPEG